MGSTWCAENGPSLPLYINIRIERDMAKGFNGTVIKEYVHSLPLGNHKITVPVGTEVIQPTHGGSAKVPCGHFIVRYPEMLESEDIIAKKDAVSFGVIVPKDHLKVWSA
tara:strand:+ start:177 stop:503 length:327 start_codon:yes stop_codon:yes gene_type:complete